MGTVRRTDLQEVDPLVYREKLRRERAMTPEERLRTMDRLIVAMRAMRRRVDKASGTDA